MSHEGISSRPDAEGSFAAGDADAITGDGPAPIREWLDAVQGVVAHNAENRPYTTLFVAGAIGYVLAAGVPPMLSKAAFNVGGRMVMARLVQTLLSEQS